MKATVVLLCWLMHDLHLQLASVACMHEQLECCCLLHAGTSHKHDKYSTVDLPHLDGVNMTEVCYTI